ncbi:unnamed protein product [Lepidochelys olivacea]
MAWHFGRGPRLKGEETSGLSWTFAESFLMAVPLCQFTGAHASIHITHLNGTTGQCISYSTPKKDPSRSTSNTVTMVTLERVDYRNTAVDISCSGVMVVITVLLSAGLIAVLAITGRK